MEQIKPNTSAGFDRLERLLLAMRVGDEMRAAEAAHLTGLPEATCRAMLLGLERAGLMTHRPDADLFVRQTLDVTASL
jgi:DNA-binding IclR family transcriptional regulator